MIQNNYDLIPESLLPPDENLSYDPIISDLPKAEVKDNPDPKSEHTINLPDREIWKSHTLYKTDIIVEVSDMGKIKYKDEILTPIKQPNGVYKVQIENKQWYIHKLVAFTFIGIKNSDYKIIHKNSNKADNRAVNLEYVLDPMLSNGNKPSNESKTEDSMGEWKQIQAWSSRYHIEVNKTGDVRLNGELLRPYQYKEAKTVNICGKNMKVWRFVAETFFPELYGGKCRVRYKDGNAMNCEMDNLIIHGEKRDYIGVESDLNWERVRSEEIMPWEDW